MLDRRVSKLEAEAIAGAPSVRLLFLEPLPGESDVEAIARQKAALGITDKDHCLAISWVSPDPSR
jgi:hypothetical protein